jgi:MoaA/NifB/PqqE/SkfB family radical SAM enzyme
MYKIVGKWPHQDSIKIEWNLGKRCNYDCSYCPSSIHDNKSRHTKFDSIKTTIDKLASLGKPIRLSFTGGEPCVHPRFDEIVRYTREKSISWISVTTNGTLPYQFYLDLKVDQYVISVHYEFEWANVVAKIQRLSDFSHKKIFAQLMAHHDHMPEVIATFDQLKKSGVPATVRRIRWTEGDHDDFDDSRYSKVDLDWIRKQSATVQANTIIDDKDEYHANDIIKLHLNQYNGWSCAAGVESLMINWDGDVHRATCRVGGSLGNIYDGTFEMPSEYITCDRSYCTCAADIPLTKYSPVQEK